MRKWRKLKLLSPRFSLSHATPQSSRTGCSTRYCDEIVLILAQCVEDPNYLYRPSIELWLRFFCPKYLLLLLEFTVFSIRRLVNGDGTSRRIRCAAPVLSKICMSINWSSQTPRDRVRKFGTYSSGNPSNSSLGGSFAREVTFE